MVVIAAAVLCAEDGAKPQLIVAEKPATLSKQSWKLLDREGGEAGTRWLEVKLESGKPGGGAPELIIITEVMMMEDRGKKMGCTSIVTYANDKAAPLPVMAQARTTVGGADCMQGAVNFAKETYSARQEVRTNPRDGKPIDPPNVRELKDQRLPKGPMIFQSALETLCPRLLDKPGELAGVVFVEFPDDLDALINVKEGYKLTRGEPGADGAFEMKLLDPRGEAVWAAKFDAKGNCLEQTFGKLNMVPAKGD
jgi:hypothetical protein